LRDGDAPIKQRPKLSISSMNIRIAWAFHAVRKHNLPQPVTASPTEEELRRHPWWRYALIGVLIIGLMLVVFLFEVNRHFGAVARKLITHELEQRYHGKVQVGQVDARLFPPSAEASDITVHLRDEDNLPPFIQIKKLTAHATFVGLLRSPKHIEDLKVEGLQITVPPRRGGPKQPHKKRRIPPFVINEMFADGTKLVIIPSKQGKDPLVFDMPRLDLRSVGKGEPMSFVTTIMNPTPPGEIQSTGYFGPWNEDDLGDTQLGGKYVFRNADLGHFHGISGILSSDGNYSGELDQISVKGTTDTPDFAVALSKKPVDLKTTFDATVDGTSGDTILNEVDASFLNSSLVCRGGVVRLPGPPGKTVSLQIDTEKARIEDLIKLAVKSKSPMTGAASFHTKFLLPPGQKDIADKLQLDGAFKLGQAHFSDLNIQQKINSLSRHGKGKPNQETGNVVSNLSAHFLLKNADMKFSDLNFEVPGALVALNGTYSLHKQQLDFLGFLKLQAKLSQTTTGIKSILLKPIDPLFKGKNAGTVIPIKVTGTQDHPSFGLDKSRLFHKK
jgi:hypothetical protein